jgi:cytochrome c peroxidase
VVKALASPITNGQPDEKAVLDRLEQIPGYAPLFKAAFPEDPGPMTGQNIAKAIGAYERTLVTPSPFDRYLAGDVDALSPKARAGLDTFMNTGCIACHNGVLVGGGTTGNLGWSRIIGKRPAARPSTPDAATSPRTPTTSMSFASRACGTSR